MNGYEGCYEWLWRLVKYCYEWYWMAWEGQYEWYWSVSMKGTECNGRVNMKGDMKGQHEVLTWRVHMKGDMKGRHEGWHEGWHEGSKVKYDKVLHLFPSPKIHTNTSERLFNISLHTTLHTTLHFPSLPFTTLQVTLQTGWRVDFWPTEACLFYLFFTNIIFASIELVVLR